MARRSCAAACAFLVLCGIVLAEDYKGAVITKVEKTRATLKVDDKEVQVVLGNQAKVFDADGKQLKGSDRTRILKEDNRVDVTTTKGRRDEVIKEIHLVSGELMAARGSGGSTGGTTTPNPTTSGTPQTYSNAVITKVERGKVTATVDGKDVVLSLGATLTVIDGNGNKLNGLNGVGIFKLGNEVEITATSRGRGLFIDQIKLIKGEMASLNDMKPAGGSVTVRTSAITRLKSDWNTYYKDAKVGDFVQYQDGNGQPQSRIEVTEVGDHTVVQVNSTYLAGRKIDAPVRMNFTVGEPTVKAVFPDMTTKKTSETTISAGGNQLRATLTESYDKSGKLVYKKWVSPEVPFDGVVREERGDGTVVKTLVQFGRGK
jgi:hypothetical protein